MKTFDTTITIIIGDVSIDYPILVQYYDHPPVLGRVEKGSGGLKLEEDTPTEHDFQGAIIKLGKDFGKEIELFQCQKTDGIAHILKDEHWAELSRMISEQEE
jgi:hypothetical protein